MSIVHVPSDLLAYTGGLETVLIEAPRIQELKQSLGRSFPGIAEQLDGMAVAIDGEIFNDADFRAVGPATEIHFVPRTVGG